MEHIIFKNPRVVYREESFGGIVYYNSQLFLLDKKQYVFLKSFIKYRTFSSLDDDEKVLVKKFLKHEIFLKIEDEIIANKTKSGYDDNPI